MSALCYTVPPEDAGRSVQSLLLGRLRFSGGRFRSLKWQPGAITLNGAPVNVRTAVQAGDELRVEPEKPRLPSRNAAGVGPSPDLVFEDEWLLVLNKPAGLSMHDRSGPSLAGTLRAYLGPGASAHFVNRLDRGTSGLLIAAKNGYIHDCFRSALHSRALYREYRALAHGLPSPPRGRVELPLGQAGGLPFRIRPDPDGKPARTDYEVLAVRDGLCLLRLVPATGRTHQLRVHMASLGCPLAGDTLYGAPDEGLIARPALHSFALRFTHPADGAELAFTAPLPPDMAALV